MTERLQIEITGALPEQTKYAILAAAQAAMEQFAATFAETHKIELAVSVKAVRPGKKAAGGDRVDTTPTSATADAHTRADNTHHPRGGD